jgi:hypothetical protein
MPEYRITDQKTNRQVTISGDTPPTEADIEEIFSSLGSQRQVSAATVRERQPGLKEYAGEAVSAFVRPAASLFDIATAPGQALLRGAGFDVPTLRSTVAERGEFAGEGAMSQAVAATGELGSMAVTGGGFQRFLAKGLTEVGRFGESTLSRVLQSLGASTPTDDLIMGMVSGAGGEAAAELSADLFGEESREFGRFAGQVVSPAAWAATGRSLVNISRSLLTEAAPDIERIRGASRAGYAMLDEAGVQANGPSISMLRGRVKDFANEFNIDPSTGKGALDSKLNQLLRAAESGKVSYGFLNEVSSSLKKLGGATDTQGNSARQAAEMIDEIIFDMVPENPEVLGGQSVSELIGTTKDLWRRASVAQSIEDLQESARLNAMKEGGDYVRSFRNSLINFLKPTNKKLKFLNIEEKKILEDVVSGDSIEKALRAFSKLGINSTDYIKTILLGTGGTAVLGAQTGQPMMTTAAAVTGLGAVGLTGLAAVARGLANQQFRSNARLGQELIKLGDIAKAKDIARIYLKETPRDRRNARDLTALLLNSRADVSELRTLPIGQNKLVSDAAALAIAVDNLSNEEQQAQ